MSEANTEGLRGERRRESTLYTARDRESTQPSEPARPKRRGRAGNVGPDHFMHGTVGDALGPAPHHEADWRERSHQGGRRTQQGRPGRDVDETLSVVDTLHDGHHEGRTNNVPVAANTVGEPPNSYALTESKRRRGRSTGDAASAFRPSAREGACDGVDHVPAVGNLNLQVIGKEGFDRVPEREYGRWAHRPIGGVEGAYSWPRHTTTREHNTNAFHNERVTICGSSEASAST